MTAAARATYTPATKENEMTSDETVKLRVTLAWSYTQSSMSEEWDTGITVEEWNDMTDEACEKEMDTAYEDTLTNQTMGGVSVITDGATS